MRQTHVYFATSRAREAKESLMSKIKVLFEVAGMKKMISPGDVVAVKLHMGEKGNTRFLRPIFARKIVEEIKEVGGKPFITDTCGLGLISPRGNSIGYLKIAAEHGYTQDAMGAPIIIADGTWGNEGTKVKVNGLQLEEVSLAKAIVQADVIIPITHFKGHNLAGFGGAIKNLGMGGTTKEGKSLCHTYGKPMIDLQKCNHCGICMLLCPVNAISKNGERMQIDQDTCNGCLHCYDKCPKRAVKTKWTRNNDLQIRMADSVFALTKAIGSRKIGIFNFIMDVTPDCDCFPWSDVPIVPDIGILASTDPVAIDKASVDLVNKAPIIPGSKASAQAKPSIDKFKLIHPETDWTVQLDSATELGLGTKNYELIEVNYLG